jgi:uncharacterized protein (DUF362 family)
MAAEINSLSKLKPLVSLLAVKSYELNQLELKLEQLLAPLGGMSAFVRVGDRVLLKPNLLTGARPTKECTTRPELVYCVAKMVIAAGGKPFLGDSPAFGSALGVARANGLAEYLSELEVPIIEFEGARYETTSTNQLSHLRLSKEAMNADVVINLPKVKSHIQLTLTMAVKNLFGCVPGKMKAWWHMEAGKDVDKFAQMLIETALAIAPQLTIVDGIIGHEGNGPSGGEPRDLGVLAASSNIFALDSIIAQILGVSAEQVPTLVAASKRGVGSNWEEVEIVGTSIDRLRLTDWQLPTEIMPIDFGLPRIVRSTFKHLYIKFIKEPLTIYSRLSRS